MSRIMAPTSAGQIRYLMGGKVREQVGTPAMAQIDREITPLIAELATLGKGNNKHPTAKQLFNWLVEPHRSAEEFTYVIGPLEQHVSIIMMIHFKSYVSISFRRGSKIVGKIAAEALAKRLTILEGPWETAGWFVANLNSRYNDHFSKMNYGFASKRLTNWIIHAIGDPELCPSPYLRIELIHLLVMMVQINESNRNQALNSIMSAFSSLNLDYLIGGNDTGFFNMDLNTIIDTLELFASENLSQCLYEFDEQVAQKLENILSMRLSIMLKDVACNHSVNPSRYSDPWELESLNALLKTVHGRIKLELKRFQDEGIYDSQWANLEPLARAVNVLVMSFRNSFKTPQLNEVAALCVIDLLELVILSNAAILDDQRGLYHRTLSHTYEILKELIDFDDFESNSPNLSVGRNIVSYDKRLKILKEKCKATHYLDFLHIYQMICFLFTLASRI